MGDTRRKATPKWTINHKKTFSENKVDSFNQCGSGKTISSAFFATMQIRGIIAQLEERMLHTHEVTGSSPVGPIHQKTNSLVMKEPGIKAGLFL